MTDWRIGVESNVSSQPVVSGQNARAKRAQENPIRRPSISVMESTNKSSKQGISRTCSSPVLGLSSRSVCCDEFPLLLETLASLLAADTESDYVWHLC
jgi:hypothetical protein